MAKNQNVRPAPAQGPARSTAGNAREKAAGAGKQGGDVKKRDWFSLNYLCIALAAVAFLLYFNTLGHGYILDECKKRTTEVDVKEYMEKNNVLDWEG